MCELTRGPKELARAAGKRILPPLLTKVTRGSTEFSRAVTDSRDPQRTTRPCNQTFMGSATRIGQCLRAVCGGVGYRPTFAQPQGRLSMKQKVIFTLPSTAFVSNSWSVTHHHSGCQLCSPVPKAKKKMQKAAILHDGIPAPSQQ